MGSRQSVSVSEKLHYPAISPVPLVSMVKRPGRSQLESSFSQSSNSAGPGRNNIQCYTNSNEVIRSEQQVGNESNTFNRAEQLDQDRQCRYDGVRCSCSLSNQTSQQHQHTRYSSDTYTSHNCLSNHPLQQHQHTRYGSDAHTCPNCLSNHPSQQHQHTRYGSDAYISHNCLQQICPVHTCITTLRAPSVDVRGDNPVTSHQHHVQNMKEKRTHGSMDSCNDCKNQGDRSCFQTSPGSSSKSELVENSLKEGKEEGTCVLVELTHQLSLTESTLGDMAESDLGPGLLYHDGEEDALVERGGSLKPQVCKLEVAQTTRDKTVDAQEEDCKSKDLVGQHQTVHSISGEAANRMLDISGEAANRMLDISGEAANRMLDISGTNGTHFASFCPSISVSKRNETADGEELQVYVHPRTGEFHSLVFGSINGEGAFMNDGTGMSPQTREFLPSASANFMQPSDMSFGTGSFSNVMSREVIDQRSSDFKPDNHCVFVGQGELFNSFGDGESHLDVQDRDRCHSQACYSHEACGQHKKSQEKQQCPDTCHYCQVKPKRVISNCEICDSVNSRLEATFGTRGSVCQFCISLSQSFAAETDNFSPMSSFTDNSQPLRESWSEEYSGSASVPATASCFVDYSNDSHDFCESSGQLHHENCYSAVKKVHECEIATEDSVLGSKPQSVHGVQCFGGICSGMYRKAIESQLLAESDIRGADTGEFHENNNGSRVLTSSLATRYDVLYCTRHSTVSEGQAQDSCDNKLSAQAPQVQTQDSCDSKHSAQVQTQDSCDSKHSAQVQAQDSCDNKHSAQAPQVQTQDSCDSKHSAQVQAQDNCDSKHSAQVQAQDNCDSKHSTQVQSQDSCDSKHSAHAPQVQAERKHLSLKCFPGQEHSISLLPAPVDKQYRKNGRDDRTKNIQKRKLREQDRQCDTSTSFLPGSSGDRLQGHDQECQVSSVDESEVTEEEEQERDEDDRLCLRKMHYSGSIPCDCRDLFQQNYAAYLCCAPDDLSQFGLSFHHLLESWGFRIFIAPRDLELTGPKYDNMARWLEERCNGKIIVVLSENYGKSDECLFLTYFARTLDPDSKNRNIIPVMIDKDVEIPNVLKGVSIIKYNYDYRCGWLKSKLVNAIAA